VYYCLCNENARVMFFMNYSTLDQSELHATNIILLCRVYNIILYSYGYVDNTSHEYFMFFSLTSTTRFIIIDCTRHGKFMPSDTQYIL